MQPNVYHLIVNYLGLLYHTPYFLVLGKTSVGAKEAIQEIYIEGWNL